MNIGDIVKRISHNMDITFKIIDIKDDIAYLKGVYVRLIADSNINDLVIVTETEIEELNRNDQDYQDFIIKNINDKVDHITGKILHFDSDSSYLDKCMALYKKTNIYAKGILINEDQIQDIIIDNIKKYRPNIIIITGHDSFNNKDKEDLSNYKNTLNFIKAIIKVREYYSLDDISIFAGACGSNFEAIIASGANFASSIDRTNIEAYDPAIVGILNSITPHDKIVDIKKLYNFSKMRKGSIGCVETYGKMRLLLR